MAKDTFAARLEEIIQSRRCSDGNCIWGHPGGVHTNGGCQSLKSSSVEARREIQVLAKELLELLELLDQTLSPGS